MLKAEDIQQARIVANAIRVRAATTASVTIATALNPGDTLDGVTLAADDLVLVKDQGSTEQNGIYLVAVVPVRQSHFSARERAATAAYDNHPGMLVTVEQGTVNADTTWLCTSNRGGTLDTTAIAFTRMLAAVGAQPLDADLTTIADNSTADRLWGTTTLGATTLVTLPAAGLALSAGALALANDLAALEGVSGTNVIPVRTGADAYAAKNYPTTTVDNTVPRFDSTGGNLQTSGVTVGDSDIVTARKYHTVTFSLADDAASSFSLAGAIFAYVFVVSHTSAQSGVAYVRVTSSVASAVLVGGASFRVQTGALTGTTGTDAFVTISPHTDGNVYIENRLGSSLGFYVTVFGGG